MTHPQTPAGSLPVGPVSGSSALSLSVPIRSFSDLGLAEPLLKAVREEGYTTPTPIQAEAIPHLLEGRDLLGCARTGTGKTAAFVLPILQRLSRSGPKAPAQSHRAPAQSHRPAHSHHAAHPNHAAHRGPAARGHGPHAGSARTLILVPTRELAGQVLQSLAAYGRHLRLSTAVVYGGVGQGPQVRALSRGVDVLVATPGRLLDLMGQGHVRLDQVEILVLDEADQMLDLGFLPAMRRILAVVPAARQTLFFSATMPAPIATLAAKILTDPVRVVVTPVASTVDEVDQSVHFVEASAKPALLAEVLSDPAVLRALVFTRTKRGADRVARGLVQRGIRAEAIHGNKSQGARERALEGFRRGRSPVLVATDIAARGIDVDGITHVVNFELPNVPESYVHRIGRTARAGATGIAISFCGSAERPFLHDIERLIRRKVRVASTREPSHARTPAAHAGRPTGRPASGAAADRGERGERGGRGDRGDRGHRGDSQRRRPFGSSPARPRLVRRSEPARTSSSSFGPARSSSFGAGTGVDT